MAKRVLILHTGGTLGMRPREPDHALAPDEFGPTVLEHAPELRQLAEIDTRVLGNVDSTDLTQAHWIDMAENVHAAAERYDGIVITHGTDAMPFTASALSFMLRNLPVPVILTGSQRPLSDPRSDARANLVGATDLATRDIPEVAIYFDGKLLRGNRTTKTSTFAFGAYESPNFPPLAEVGTGVKIVTEPLRPGGPLQMSGAFDNRVMVVRLLPAQRGEPLRALLGVDLKAVLVEAFGVGNIPVVDGSVSEALAALVGAGVVVAIASPSPHGAVDLDRYAGGRSARRAGAVGIGDMTLEAAAVKLMYLLGTHREAEQVRQRLHVPLAGEITVD